MIKNIDGKQIEMKQKKNHQNTLICHVLCLSFDFHLHILRRPNAKRTTLSIK